MRVPVNAINARGMSLPIHGLDKCIAAGIGPVTLLIIGLSPSRSERGVQIITGCAASGAFRGQHW
jgi:hypothetical protein